jgi:hypothetical protein
MWMTFGHLRPSGHIIPDHAGARSAVLLVLAPHDHLSYQAEECAWNGPSVVCLIVALTVAGRLVRDPVEIWRGYAIRTRTLREYDLAGAGDPAVLVAAEVARTRIIASRVTRQEGAWFVRRAADAPWGVSADADLACADPAGRGGLFDNAAALYWHFTTPHQVGIGPAKIHKVLHIKRPGLYPVLVRRLYRAQARRWVNRIPNARPGDSMTFWAAIRDDLTDEDNRSVLSQHRAELREDPQIARMADLTSLRLLDIVAWETARREFGR